MCLCSNFLSPADGNADFAKSIGKCLIILRLFWFTQLHFNIGMELDLRPRGMGIRSKVVDDYQEYIYLSDIFLSFKRYAMIVENRIVKWIGLDDSGLEKSSAESLLAQLI